MINAIIEAISISLNEEFGDEYEIMMEESKQDLNEPCFFISCLNPTTRLYLGSRYFRENQFFIQYFPSTEDVKDECNAVAERLIWCMEYINVTGDKMRGTDIKYEVVDGILNFFVKYDCFVYRVKEKIAMETIEKTQNVKG